MDNLSGIILLHVNNLFLTDTDFMKIIEFWSGSPEVADDQSFKVETCSGEFPKSHSCTYELLLPTTHENYEDFKTHIMGAVQDNFGFGMV